MLALGQTVLKAFISAKSLSTTMHCVADRLLCRWKNLKKFSMWFWSSRVISPNATGCPWPLPSSTSNVNNGSCRLFVCNKTNKLSHTFLHTKVSHFTNTCPYLHRFFLSFSIPRALIGPRQANFTVKLDKVLNSFHKLY
jgi:hypothetical protein